MEPAPELTDAEQLILFGFRMTAWGRPRCPAVTEAFRRECGERAGEALAAFQAVILFIGRQGARKLRVRPPGCHELTADETAVLAMIASAQRALRPGAETELQARLEWLLGRSPNVGLVFAAQTVAAALLANDRVLPARGPAAPEAARARWRDLRVVH
jgi:hypothetical protein